MPVVETESVSFSWEGDEAADNGAQDELDFDSDESDDKPLGMSADSESEY